MEKKILIVDDHPLLRMGVRTFLERNVPGVSCFDAESEKSVLGLLKTNRFDFVLMDISLGVDDGLELAGQIKEKQPDCRVIVLSMHKEPLLVEKARQLGLDGYLVKEDAFSSFKDIFLNELAPGFILSDKLREAPFLTGNLQSEISLISRYNTLTNREQSVFRLLAEGMNYKEIGVELEISKKTVLVHRYNLMKKMKTEDQTGIVKTALQLGLIDPHF